MLTLLLALAPAAQAAPTLVVPELLPGQPAPFEVRGALPGATATLIYGWRVAPGPCFPSLGGLCADVAGGGVLASATVDATGRAVFPLELPTRVAPGTAVAFQVLLTLGGGSARTPTVGTAVLHPDDVCDRTTPLGQVTCDLLAGINATREVGATCPGGGVRTPTHPLVVDDLLTVAAQAQADWMAANSKLSHRSPGGPLGTTLDERIAATGYLALRGTENLGRGQDTVAEILSSWLASDGHCKNLTDSRVREIGLGATSAGTGPWWSAVFAEPR